MRIPAALRSALAIVAAIIGAGFASGREIMTFFSEMGAASWLGVAIACALSGGIVAMLARLGAHTGAKSFPGRFGALMGQACEDAMHLSHGLLMAILAAVMLSAGGELGALVLPLHGARYIGMALTLACGLLAARGGALARLGGAMFPCIFLFFAALALDGRNVDASVYAQNAHAIYSGAPLAALLGAVYAALNLSLAGGVVLLNPAQPRKVGLYTALLLAALLLPANVALLRHRETLQFVAMPSVVLAARWGSAGFYLCALCMYLSVVSTMAAAIASLRAQLAGVRRSPWALAGILALSAFFSLSGFDFLVRSVYPLLGWLCALALAALAAFVDWPAHVKFPWKVRAAAPKD